jgi:hypothetical protein
VFSESAPCPDRTGYEPNALTGPRRRLRHPTLRFELPEDHPPLLTPVFASPSSSTTRITSGPIQNDSAPFVYPRRRLRTPKRRSGENQEQEWELRHLGAFATWGYILASSPPSQTPPIHVLQSPLTPSTTHFKTALSLLKTSQFSEVFPTSQFNFAQLSLFASRNRLVSTHRSDHSIRRR